MVLQTILAQLRTIFDLIIQFEGIQQELYAAANDELTLRRNYEQTLARREKEGKWGAVGSQAEDEEARKVDFEKTIVPKIRRQLRLLTDSYQVGDLTLTCILYAIDESFCYEIFATI